jgi:hypothetical protein
LTKLPQALHYRHKFAGHYAGEAAPFLQPVKIKSHMTEHAAAALGLATHWFGNSKADKFANEAWASTGSAGKEYIEQQKTAFCQPPQDDTQWGQPSTGTYEAASAGKPRAPRRQATAGPTSIRPPPAPVALHSMRDHGTTPHSQNDRMHAVPESSQ